MTLFQTVILAAGSNTFLNSEISKTKILAPLTNQGSTLFEESLIEYHGASNTVCAVNPEDFDFAKDVAVKYRNVTIKPILQSTRGALVTLAICLEDLNPKLPIVVTSVDGLVKNTVNQFAHFMFHANFDGGAMIMNSKNPELSYVMQVDGTPIEFAEKKVISNFATTGVFYFSNVELVKKAIEWVLLSKTELNGMYYISSALNRFIFDNKKVGLYEVNPDQYLRFSTPAEYKISRNLYEGPGNEPR